ncbi:MAG: 4-hydroxythreonine-4-phosphate dehydrogenase PdxA [Candidatus Omnitrophota bacterium]
MKPIIGITMGDPAGIGSEIIVKALHHPHVYEKCRPVVIGDQRAIEDALNITGLSMETRTIDAIGAAAFDYGTIDVYDLNNINHPIAYGKVDADCGRAAGEYIEKAIRLAMDKEIAAMVTGPINKESFDLGGYGKKYRGHTEMLAALTHSKKASMMLASGNMRVIHVTTHVSMRQAVDLITQERVYNTIHKAHEACRELGIASPRIGVCGLNPHAGEGGIMGDEEINAILPAIEKARAEGLTVEGPIPGDTIYPRLRTGTFDVIVAMYHDQGHIPVKLTGFLWNGESWSSVSGVNITIGLPIIRVSVDHGTAFGKAGKGAANETSMIDAIEYAILIAKNRNLN